jgi:VIT1/CCC1 family predicted Fe2+/Mn2+ transporter
MHIDLAQTLSFVVGVLLPVLTGLVTKQAASGSVRAVVLLALSAVSGFVSNWLDAVTTHVPFNVGTTFITVLGTFVVGVAAHFGWWKPTGVSDAVKRVGGFIGPRSV